MHELALVVFQPGYVWPFEVVQDTAGVDEELGFVFEDISGGKVLYFELPDTLLLVPLGVFDFVLKLDVFVDEIILHVDALEIVEDLGRERIEMCPGLYLPGKLVVDTGNLLLSACGCD